MAARRFQICPRIAKWNPQQRRIRQDRRRCCRTASAHWFAGRGWTPRAHQLELLAKARAGRSVLLIAPTGGGKTLAGFLPTLVELSERTGGAASAWFRPAATSAAIRACTPSTSRRLKALAVDIARNLEIPVREMGLPVRLETRTGDTPASKRQRQRRDPPDILLTTPEQLALLLASADAPYMFSYASSASCSTNCIRWSRRSAAICCRSAWRGCSRWRRRLTTVGLSATVAEPDELCRFLVPQPLDGHALRRSGDGGSRRAAERHHARHHRAPALGRAFGAPRARRNLRAHQAPQDHADLRQHPQPGRIHLSVAVGHQRRQSRHRAASRLARRRAAPQGRGRHERRQIARGGVHLVARSRRRLGRCRSGDQYRRAERFVAAAAAYRPLQPPARRAVAGGAGAGQPLRSAGMPRRHRCRRRECAGHAALAHRRARRAGAAYSRPRRRRAVPRRRTVCRSARRRALRQLDARRFRRRGRFRRHRRLCAQGLRTLRQDPPEQGRQMAHHPSAAWRSAIA